MADVTRFITYYIQLTNPALVAQYQAQFPYGYQFAPYNPLDSTTHQPGGAAVAFSAPWSGSTPVAAGVNGTWSPDAGNYDTTVATFERHTGGFWGMGGTTTRYYWVGQFKASDPATPTIGSVVPPSPTNLAKKIFIEGWEFGNNDGIANIGGTGVSISRGASRHVGGFGLALRGPTSGSYSVSRNVFGAAANTRTWERFYVRLRVADPTNAIGFWGCNGSVSGSSGARLAFTPDNRIALMNLDNTGAESLLATSTAQVTPWDGRSTLDGFHKIDVLVRFNPNDGATPILTGRISVFLDGVSIIYFRTIANPTGMGQNQNHISSLIGTQRSLVNTMECDVDDWSVNEWPGLAESAGGPTLTGRDWLSGTKIVAARAKAFGTNHSVNWVGSIQNLMQLPLSTAGNDNMMTSSTSGAVAEADLDVDLCVAKDEGMLGVTSFVLHEMLFSNSVGTIGYRLNGGANVDVADTEGVTRTGCVVLKDLANGAAATFQPFTSLTARHTKAIDVLAANIGYMGAQVEMIGAWGTGEDYRVSENAGGTTPTFPRFVDQHNAPYPRSMFGKGTAAPPPDSPVIFVAGSYVGNGTGQDLTFRAPVCAFFASATAAGAGGYRWISGGDGAHIAMNEGVHPQLVRADQDTTFVAGVGVDTQQERYRIRLTGSDSRINQIGVTYQYLAIIDPGARFFLSGTVDHKAAQGTTINNLINDAFTPEAMWFQSESLTNATADGGYYKGVGVTTDNLLRGTTTAQLAAAVTLGTGLFTTQAAFHALAGNHMVYLAMRRHDGNSDPGEPGVLALVNWTGDGTASRTISIAPTSGKRPIYAVIFASDAGGAYFRDVANTTTNSQRANNGTNSATAITGGAIDSLSVGVTLNANGTVYSGFVLMGDATAGNGGFGVNNEYIPVEAAPPANGPFPLPTLANFDTTTPVVPLVGEPDLEDTTDILDAATEIGGLVGGNPCEYYSRKIANAALSRIGVSKRIVSLSTDNNQEAVLSRYHMLEDVNATLRAFDWPFATRYATLVLVGGTSTVPVNDDWQYSYRGPSSMMKARRLVSQSGTGREYDEDPPKFIMGSDSSGPLLFTNESNADDDLILEYTVRISCPAFYGDALFRNALAWKHAESLAPVLSKDSKKQDYCRARFDDALKKAEVPAAQEQQQPKQGDAPWINERN